MPDHYRNAKNPTWWSSQSEAAWHFLFDLVMLANSRILFNAAFALFDICRISWISSSIEVILGIFSVVSIEMSPRFTAVLLLGLFWLKHVMIFQPSRQNNQTSPRNLVFVHWLGLFPPGPVILPPRLDSWRGEESGGDHWVSSLLKWKLFPLFSPQVSKGNKLNSLQIASTLPSLPVLCMSW